MKRLLSIFLLLPGVFLLGLPSLMRAQYLDHSFKSNAKNGERIYKSACAACHGGDGTGTPKTISAFERPDTFPDFTRCDQTTAEVDTGYKAVIEHGGPSRGFSQIMPAFGEALSSQDIDDVIAYLRQFCRQPSWPRGELNLPRALVTEKAYPEDELVLSTSINAQGMPGNESHIIHEQRFGKKNQVEVDVPISFEDQNHVWYGGVGDTTIGVKRVMFSSLQTGSILSLQGGFLLPSGNRARGFGAGTTTFETFAAFRPAVPERHFRTAAIRSGPAVQDCDRSAIGVLQFGCGPELCRRSWHGAVVVADGGIPGDAGPDDCGQDGLGCPATIAGDDQ